MTVTLTPEATPWLTSIPPAAMPVACAPTGVGGGRRAGIVSALWRASRLLPIALRVLMWVWESGAWVFVRSVPELSVPRAVAEGATAVSTTGCTASTPVGRPVLGF
eukprot:828715-Prymnesium_polylepis.1